MEEPKEKIEEFLEIEEHATSTGGRSENAHKSDAAADPEVLKLTSNRGYCSSMKPPASRIIYTK